MALRGRANQALPETPRRVPREDFTPGKLVELADEDAPLPIEAGQAISQPDIVAPMISAAGV